MKKIISVVMSVVMIAAMVLGMTGCGKDTPGEKDKELYGKWHAEIDLFEITGPMFDDDDKFSEYIDADEFVVTMRYEFKRNGTYKIYTDEKQLQKAVEKVTDEIREGLNEYFQAAIDEGDLDMTVDELLEELDMSMDSLIDSMFGEEIVQELIDSLVSEGQYYVKEGVIYMSASKDVVPSEEGGQKYEISGDELTLYAPEGATGNAAKGYPLVLESGK